MPYDFIRTSQVERTLWIELHNPPLNFLQAEMLSEVFEAIQAAEADDGIRVIVLTGALEDQFAAHYDVEEIYQTSQSLDDMSLLERSLSPMLANSLGQLVAEKKNLQSILSHFLSIVGRDSARVAVVLLSLGLAIERCDKVTIAAINGNCLGAANELAMCCDLRFMVGDQEFVVGQPEILIGFMPGAGGTQRLPRLIGKAKALEFILTGCQVPVVEAKRIGWLTEAFPKEEFRQQVQRVADELASRSSVAVAAIKQSMGHGAEDDLLDGLQFELRQVIKVMRSEEFKQLSTAYLAFLEIELGKPAAERKSIAGILAAFAGDRSASLTRSGEEVLDGA